jgi:hypothetical protein
VQSNADPQHIGRLWGDVPALLVVAALLGWLCPPALKLRFPKAGLLAIRRCSAWRPTRSTPCLRYLTSARIAQRRTPHRRTAARHPAVAASGRRPGQWTDPDGTSGM